MNRILRALLFSIVLFPSAALAIPPPDFIVNVGAQVAAVASVVFLFLSAAFTTAFQFMKARLTLYTKKRWVRVALMGLMITTVGSAIGAHFYFKKKVQAEYDEWLAQSQEERTEILVEDWFEVQEQEEGTEVGSLADVENPVGPSFFELHESEGNIISNEKLAAALASDREDYVLLDARENLEVEAGYIPDSTHIRFADLLSGEWKDLDPNKYIYVLCSTAMRGEEVSTFLREKELMAQHLEGGAVEWVDWGGSFEGTITFSEAFPNWYYHAYLDTSDVRAKVSNGAILVDSREPETFTLSGLPGSLFIALLYTPTEDLEKSFAQVPAGSSVITVCDDWINCFDAKMVGIELERRGYNFLGRYKSPDEY